MSSCPSGISRHSICVFFTKQGFGSVAGASYTADPYKASNWTQTLWVPECPKILTGSFFDVISRLSDCVNIQSKFWLQPSVLVLPQKVLAIGVGLGSPFCACPCPCLSPYSSGGNLLLAALCVLIFLYIKKTRLNCEGIYNPRLSLPYPVRNNKE